MTKKYIVYISYMQGCPEEIGEEIGEFDTRAEAEEFIREASKKTNKIYKRYHIQEAVVI